MALALEIAQPIAQTPAVDTVDVLIRAFTPEGAPRESATRTFAFDHLAAGSPATYEAVTRLDLAPGRYELRVAAHSALTDKRGNVYADMDVPDFPKAPLSLSAVVFDTAARAPHGAIDALQDVVPVVPTTTRIFGTSDAATAFVRVFQAARAPLAPVALTTRIRNAHDAAVLDETRTLGPDAFDTSHKADVKTRLPLDTLTAGAYVLSYDASLGKTSVKREVRFTVR